jgi:hypothetical protein
LRLSRAQYLISCFWITRKLTVYNHRLGRINAGVVEMQFKADDLLWGAVRKVAVEAELRPCLARKSQCAAVVLSKQWIVWLVERGTDFGG